MYVRHKNIKNTRREQERRGWMCACVCTCVIVLMGACMCVYRGGKVAKKEKITAYREGRRKGGWEGGALLLYTQTHAHTHTPKRQADRKKYEERR